MGQKEIAGGYREHCGVYDIETREELFVYNINNRELSSSIQRTLTSVAAAIVLISFLLHFPFLVTNSC